MTTALAPTASQLASASVHLERQQDWRVVRIAGVRYVVLQSGRSQRTYMARADGNGCSCKHYQTRGTACSHMLAIRQACQPSRPLPTHGSRSLTDLDAQAALDAIQAGIQAERRQSKPRPSYADVFGVCDVASCDEDRERGERYCSRHVVVSAF